MAGKMIGMAVAGAALATALPASAAVLYTSDAAFNAAAAGTTLTMQSFESTPTGQGTAAQNFGNVTVSCAGGTYCPSNFGWTSSAASDGSYSVKVITPTSITFTFASKITDFAIDVLGLGANGSTTLYVNDGAGQLAVWSNYNPGATTTQTMGLIDSAGFTSVTFTGLLANNSIRFDRLRFGATPAAGAVPEPASWAMLIAGFGLAGIALRRRRTATPHLA